MMMNRFVEKCFDFGSRDFFCCENDVDDGGE
jgi:hypothetical protein